MGETPQNADRSVPAGALSKHALFEPVALVLLTLATVGTRLLVGVRATTLDGDKLPAESGENSPHSKGFAVNQPTQVLLARYQVSRLVVRTVTLAGLLASVVM